jgi:hypothetical protein
LLRGDVLRALAFDESGRRASDAWSGTSQNGGTLHRFDGLVADDCNNWTSNDASLDSSLASSLAVGFYWLNFFSRCSDGPRALQCFADDLGGPIAEAPVAGRWAFLSSAPFTPNQGIAAADRLCQQDACAAGLTGSSDCATDPGSARRFLSYLYTSAQPAAQRFELSGPTWVRRDGLAWLPVASDLAGDAPARLTGLNVLANGTLDNSGAGDFIWIGGVGANESCQDWTSSTGTGLAGSVGQINASPLFKTDTACDREARVICLEQ